MTELELTDYGNVTVDSCVLLAPIPTQRNIKLKRVSKWYTENELQELLKDRTYSATSERYQEPFQTERKRQSKENNVHRFTELEDEFIRNNYQYLSDNTIALALNLPYKMVQARRHRLGLKKEHQPTNALVIVWDNRNQYEKDLEKEGFTLLRPNLR